MPDENITLISPIAKGDQNQKQFKKPLYIIWICDCSDSMRSGNKIREMNEEIEKSIKTLQEFNKTQSKAQIFMRTLKFSTGADWVDSDFIPIESYQWKPLEATEEYKFLGYALSHVTDVLRLKEEGGSMPSKGFRPHLILFTDGYPDDDWETGLNNLMSTFWGKVSNRIAIPIGDAVNDEQSLTVLKQYVGNVEDADRKNIPIIPLEIMFRGITVLYNDGSFFKHHIPYPIPSQEDDNQRTIPRPSCESNSSTSIILKNVALERIKMHIYSEFSLPNYDEISMPRPYEDSKIKTLTKQEIKIVFKRLNLIKTLSDHGFSKCLPNRVLDINIFQGESITRGASIELVYTRGGSEFGVYTKLSKGWFIDPILNKILRTFEKNSPKSQVD